MPLVSIIFPARNEEATLPMLLSDLKKTISNLTEYEFEVICVYDHSTDKTVEIVESFNGKAIPNIGENGKGMALRTGFQSSKGEILVMMDADYSHRPEDLPSLLEALKGDTGLVIASRGMGGSEEYSPVRAFGNFILSKALGIFTGCYLADALNGYKVFRRDIFTDFQYTSTAFEIEIEIIANTLRKGYRIIEVSSFERARAGGVAKSKVILHGTRFLLRIMYEGFKGVKPKPELSMKHQQQVDGENIQ
jgi:glycosyltransferase involved in cell wall biosynthesis